MCSLLIDIGEQKGEAGALVKQDLIAAPDHTAKVDQDLINEAGWPVVKIALLARAGM